MRESLHALLKFATIFELTLRTFRAFPGALLTVRRVFLLVLATTYVGILAMPTTSGATVMDAYGTLGFQILPRIQNGTIWLFTAVAAVILWYRLPVEPLHKAILLGFVPYLLIFTVGLNAVNAYGLDVRIPAGYAFVIAYLLVVCYWTYAAWRPLATSGKPPTQLPEKATSP
jgi:hypothetical protein